MSKSINTPQKAMDDGKRYNSLCEEIEQYGYDNLSLQDKEFVVETRKKYMDNLRKESTANYVKYKFVGESESAGIELVVDNLKANPTYKLEHNDVVKECYVLVDGKYVDIRNIYDLIQLGKPLTLKYVTTAYNSIFSEEDEYKEEKVLPTSKNETFVELSNLIYKSKTNGTGGNF